ARRATRSDEGQLLLALPQPRSPRRSGARDLGANDHVCGHRRDRGRLGRSTPAASAALQTRHGTGRPRPDRARTAGNRRPSDRAAGARPRPPPPDRLRRRTLPSARLPAPRRETTRASRLQHLPRLRPTPPRHTATTAANTGGQTRVPQRRSRRPDLTADAERTALISPEVRRPRLEAPVLIALRHRDA